MREPIVMKQWFGARISGCCSSQLIYRNRHICKGDTLISNLHMEMYQELH